MKKAKYILIIFLMCLPVLMLVSCSHKHEFSSDFAYDDNYHWNYATCEHKDEKANYVLHTFGEWIETKAATEEEKGILERSCTVCGYKEKQDIEKLPHTHKFSSEWSYDEANHWHSDTCGHNQKSDEAAHTFDDGLETIDGIKYICTVCGYEKIEKTNYRVSEAKFKQLLSSANNFITKFSESNYTGIYYVTENIIKTELDMGIAIYVNNADGCDYYSEDKDGNWKKETYSGNDGHEIFNYYKNLSNNITDFQNNYASFSYDSLSKTYKCASLTINKLKYKNIFAKFEDDKIIEFGFYLDGYTYVYTDFGSVVIDIPTN